MLGGVRVAALMLLALAAIALGLRRDRGALPARARPVAAAHAAAVDAALTAAARQ